MPPRRPTDAPTFRRPPDVSPDLLAEADAIFDSGPFSPEVKASAWARETARASLHLSRALAALGVAPDDVDALCLALGLRSRGGLDPWVVEASVLAEWEHGLWCPPSPELVAAATNRRQPRLRPAPGVA